MQKAHDAWQYIGHRAWIRHAVVRWQYKGCDAVPPPKALQDANDFNFFTNLLFDINAQQACS